MRYIIKDFSRHRWRTIFSITGYSIATVFILIILSISGSNKTDSFGILQGTGTHLIVYIPTDESICTSSTAGGTVFAEGVNTLMMDEGLLVNVKNTEGIRDAAPCLLYKMNNETFKTDISIAGIDTVSFATNTNVCARNNVIEGRYFSHNPDEVVALESFSKAHNLSPGDTLDIFGSKLVLAGIVNPGIRPVKADFYGPIGLVRTILKDNLQCSAPNFDMNIILVEVADSRRQDDVIGRLKNMMYKFSVSSYNCYQPAYRVMSIIEKSSTGLTILVLIFLVIFTGKTQLAALIEHFREIGILKSLGWSDFDLSAHILLVAFIQAFIGVTIGFLLGAGLIEILKRLELPVSQYVKFQLQYTSIPLLYSLALAGAFIAGIFPIIKIYRTKAGEIINNYL